jgi:hypothetical protein
VLIPEVEMLKFQSVLPLNRLISAVDAISLLKEWVTGSPYTDLSISPGGLQPGHREEYKTSSQSFEIVHLAGTDANYIGCVWLNRDTNGREWRSEAIVKTGDVATLSVRVNVTTDRSRPSSISVARPYIIKNAMRRLLASTDSLLDIKSTAHHIDESEAGILFCKQIFEGNASQYLPVVYISRDDHNELALDIDGLARQLGSVAHVVVEPSRKFSFRLMDIVESKNPYGGAVGLFWPGIGPSWRYVPLFEKLRGEEIARAIAERVLDGLCLQPLARDITWDGLLRMQILQRSNEADINIYEELVKNFETEARQHKKEADDFKDEVRILKSEIEILKSESVLELGSWREQYLHETRAHLVRYLKKSVNKENTSPRTSEILTNIISLNERYIDVLEQKKDELKSIFYGNTGLSGGDISRLRGLSINIVSDKNHYKMIYAENPAYTFSWSKTSSDSQRAGKNLVAEIAMKIF